MEALEQILRRLGPCLSPILSDELEKMGLSSTAARKRISRSRDIGKLEKVPFANKTIFVYPLDAFNSRGYWSALDRAMMETPLYGNALHALEARGGMVPRSDFSVFSGCPAVAMTRHVSSETLLNRLLGSGILEEHEDCTLGSMVRFNDRTALSGHLEAKEIQSRLLAERVLLLGLEQWLKNLGLGSFNRVETRGAGTVPRFGQFDWDLTAPSYVLPFRGYQQDGSPKPGFVVADVVLADAVSRHQLEYFLGKCKVMLSQRSTRPFMPIFVCQGFTREAMESARGTGIVAATTRNILGDEVARSLRSLMSLLTKQAEVAEPELIQSVFNNLSRIEGAALNLRGPLFELIATRLVKQHYAGSVDHGKQVRVPENGALVDIDVLHVGRATGVTAIECKAREPGGVVDESEALKWLERTIPRIRAWMNSEERFRGQDQTFELWTTGAFSPNAEALLEKEAAKVRKYTLRFRRGKDVAALASDLKETRLLSFLREQFLYHPLA